MTLQFKTRHCNGILLRGFIVKVYSFTIGKFVLTSVSTSASVYYFSCFIQKIVSFLQGHCGDNLKGTLYIYTYIYIYIYI